MSLGKLPGIKGLGSGSQGKRRFKSELSVDMISPPLPDFRHTMHVGRGGDVFGDTSFLSNHGGKGESVSPDSPTSSTKTTSFFSRTLRHVRRSPVPRARIGSRDLSPPPPPVSPIIKNAISLPQLNIDMPNGYQRVLFPSSVSSPDASLHSYGKNICNGKKHILHTHTHTHTGCHFLFSNLQTDASRVAQWARVLHCSASCATRDSDFERSLCRSRPWPGDPWGLASSGLGRVWPSGMSLSHCALATPVAGRAQCTLTRSPGVRCFLRHIGAAGFRVGCVLCKKQWGLVGLCFGGRMALNLRLSRVHTGVVVMRQESNY